MADIIMDLVDETTAFENTKPTHIRVRPFLTPKQFACALRLGRPRIITHAAECLHIKYSEV
jgi:hypothetical protein